MALPGLPLKSDIDKIIEQAKAGRGSGVFIITDEQRDKLNAYLGKKDNVPAESTTAGSLFTFAAIGALALFALKPNNKSKQ